MLGVMLFLVMPLPIALYWLMARVTTRAIALQECHIRVLSTPMGSKCTDTACITSAGTLWNGAGIGMANISLLLRITLQLIRVGRLRDFRELFAAAVGSLMRVVAALHIGRLPIRAPRMMAWALDAYEDAAD